LAAHTCANWEGVKVSERGRVSMEALRDGLIQFKGIQGWGIGGRYGGAISAALVKALQFASWW
jgi:hypothetical protein